jgi:hypothetical protein
VIVVSQAKRAIQDEKTTLRKFAFVKKTPKTQNYVAMWRQFDHQLALFRKRLHRTRRQLKKNSINNSKFIRTNLECVTATLAADVSTSRLTAT